LPSCLGSDAYCSSFPFQILSVDFSFERFTGHIPREILRDVEAAYRRGDLFAKRRKMMQE